MAKVISRRRKSMLEMKENGFVTFPCGILGQVWYLLVLNPDLRRLTLKEAIFGCTSIHFPTPDKYSCSIKM